MGVLGHLAKLGRSTVVLFGLETHVCVQQTALDLIAKGYTVHVISDGVASQRPEDRDTALQRLRQDGAYVTNVDGTLFELVRSKDHPQFKKISGLVKSYADELKKGI